MPKTYADSSLIASLYLPDVHSKSAVRAVEDKARRIAITPLVIVETTNAIQLRLFRKERDAAQIRESMAAFESDLNDGVFEVLSIPSAAWEVARQLCVNHTPALGSRTGDTLHVAAAIALKIETLLTFDRNQTRLAEAAGLRVPLR